ncbi:MAG: hypothetical protein NVS2B7_33140 [Herpetosiphon sp.]
MAFDHDYLNMQETAARLGLSRIAVLRAVRRGALRGEPRLRRGGYRFRARDVNAYAVRRRQDAAQPAVRVPTTGIGGGYLAARPSYAVVQSLASLLASGPANDGLDDSHQIADLLALIAESLAFDLAFVSRLDGCNLYVDQVADRGGIGLETGTIVPLPTTYCASLLDGRLPGLAIEDTLADPHFATLYPTVELGVRSYVGVPMVDDEGIVRGTLCVLHREARQIDMSEIVVLSLAARVVQQVIAASLARKSHLLLERAVEERVQELETVFGTITDGLLTLDLEGRVVQANNACLSLMGLTNETASSFFARAVEERAAALVFQDSQGQPLPADQLPQKRIARGDVLAGSTALEVHARSLDGREMWWNISGGPLRDAQGEVSGGVMVIRDVTERHLFAERVTQENQRLQEMFKQAPALIALFSGPEHVFTVANPLCCLVANRKVESLLGMPVRRVFPEVEGQGIYDLLDHAYVGGESIVRNEVPVQYERDGSLVQSFFSFVLQPTHGVSGAVDGVLFHGIEVTDQVNARKQAERLAAQVRDERDRFQQVLDVLPEAILIADTTPTFIVANHAARDILGVDAVGQAVPMSGDDAFNNFGVQMLDGTPYPAQDLPLERALLHGEVVRGDQFLIRNGADNRQVPVLANAAPLRDASGTIRGGVVAFQDITAIWDLERAREEFLSSAAHDLKTPLTIIRAGTQLAVRRLSRIEADGIEAVVRTLTSIEVNTQRMLDLINELVDVTRVQMGTVLDLHPVATDLVALVRGVIEQHRGVAPQRIQFDTNQPQIQGVVDGTRLERVIANMLSNAIKYSAADDSIDVHVMRDDGPSGAAVSIAVQDRGMGIPANDLPHIFERFHRASNVVGHIPGTGIGLASAQQIVAQHGGTMSVTSREGEGSTFTVRLPL